MGMAFVPLYIKYLGMEAYGLIGVFAVLQAWLSLLDLGMTPAVNREMARFTAGMHTTQSICDLLRSLEIICLGIASLCAVAMWLVSAWLAEHWLRVEKLPLEEVAHAVSIIGIVVALRFFEGLYRSALLGLQKQVLFNAVNALLATLRGVGVLGALVWLSPTIEVFFLWQGGVSVIATLVLANLVRRNLPEPDLPPNYSHNTVSNVWQFAKGMFAVTLLSLVLMQTDKVLLSRLLSLESFGYYTLAASVSGVLYLLVTPIAQSFFPRFTELVAKGDSANLARSYHQSAQLVAVLIIPAALILVFFGEYILELWTGDTTLAHKVAPVLTLLAIGWMCNGLMNPPYMLQIAYGWTGFAIRVNVIAVLFLVPAIFYVTPLYGAIGAASVWAALNVGYVLIAIHFMHCRLLKDEKWHWYSDDVFFPLVVAVCTVGFSKVVHPQLLSKFFELVWLMLTGCVAVIASTMASPLLRGQLIKWIKEYSGKYDA